MTGTTRHPAGRSGGRRSGPRAVPVLALAGLCVALLPACSSAAAHAPAAGAYPVATPASAVLATPTAGAGHYALVSAGDPVQVDVGGAQLVARVDGPELTVPPGPPPDHAAGVLTVTLTSTQGELTVQASSFLLLDKGRVAVATRADAAAVHVAPGSPATLRLSADVPAGHGTLTWQLTGHPLVTWDFVVEVELDAGGRAPAGVIRPGARPGRAHPRDVGDGRLGSAAQRAGGRDRPAGAGRDRPARADGPRPRGACCPRPLPGRSAHRPPPRGRWPSPPRRRHPSRPAAGTSRSGRPAPACRTPRPTRCWVGTAARRSPRPGRPRGRCARRCPGR